MLKVSLRSSQLYVLSTIGFVMMSQTCFATFVVSSGNDPSPDQENVSFDLDLIGTSVQGATNQTGTQVDLTPSGQFLASQGAGIEARALSDINSSQVPIEGSVTMSLVDSDLAFSSLTFNAFNGGPVGSGGSLSITVTGFESDGTPVTTTLTQSDLGGPLALNNGGYFFTVSAIDGQLITAVEISADSGSSYAGLRQLRIGGIVPEPATWALLGLAGMALVVRLRAGRKAALRR